MFSLFVGDSVSSGARWGFSCCDRTGDAGLVYGGCQPVCPSGHAPRLPADGEVDRRHRRYAIRWLRYSSDYFALTLPSVPPRRLWAGRVLMTELLQIVGREAGHFHNRNSINARLEHGLCDVKKRSTFALFMPSLIALLHTFLAISARVISTVICCLFIHQAWRAEASRGRPA